MRVAVCRPGKFGRTEISRWQQWQRDDRRLQSPFLAPEFAIAADRERHNVRVAVIEDGGETVGFWAYSLGRLGAAGPVVPGYSDWQGVVHSPELEIDWTGLLSGCGLNGWRFDHLDRHQANHQLVTTDSGLSRMIDLRAGWATYVEWSREEHRIFLSGIQRKRRRLEREHEVSYSDHDAAAGTLVELMTLKSRQCRRRGWRDVFDRPWIRRFVRDLASTDTPAFSGKLSTLRLDGQLALVTLGLQAWSSRAVWFTAFDERFASGSPGLVGYLYMGEAAAASGVGSIDLGKGDESFKEHLGNASCELVSGWVASPSARSLLFRAGRLPGRITDTVFARVPSSRRVATEMVHSFRRRTQRADGVRNDA